MSGRTESIEPTVVRYSGNLGALIAFHEGHHGATHVMLRLSRDLLAQAPEWKFGGLKIVTEDQRCSRGSSTCILKCGVWWGRL